nr:hypothetical protein [Tanacetum cinerariifolium]
VPEVFIQQFWYTIKKVKDSESYEFLLAKKKCIVNAEVFRKILDICPRLKGEEFTKPWRTLAAIINKCLSGKNASNDRLRKSRINILKAKTSHFKTKLKGVQSLTLEEQEAIDTMQALKESKKTSRRQPGTRGSSEGTCRISGVPDNSTVISTTSSEGTGTKLGVPDEEKDNDGNTDDEDEDDDHISDSQDNDDEDAKTESDEDEIYKYKIQVHKDMDVEMKEAKTIDRENKEKDEMTDATKDDVEKTAEEKSDSELAGNVMTSDYQVKVSTKFPLTSSSLSISSGFGTHFLNLSSDAFLTGVLKDTIEAEITSLMDVHI